MFDIPLWAYLIACVFYAVIYWRRVKLRRSMQIVNVTEGRHRVLKRGGGL